tara:strand:+ start:734 stop:1279 length:546 start_codon:yes stop_codon:yes gene_type:complete
MANKSKNVNDIVSQTARALGTGKSFGGWADTVEEDTYKRHVKKQHASREREKEEKDEEPLTIHGPDGTRKNPQYSKFTYPKDVTKESVEEDYIEQKPDGMWCVYNDDGKIVKEFKTKSEAENSLDEGVGAMIGGALGSVVPGIGTAIGAAVGGGAEWLMGAVSNNKKKFKKSKGAGEGATE